MVRASYRSNQDIYELVEASEENIRGDLEFATQWIKIDDEYEDRMKRSVRQGLGFRVLKNGERIGTMYNMVLDGEYIGCSIYCKDDRVGMMVILKSMFEVYDWYKIVVMPHEDGLKYFVSMATSGSIKEYHLRGTPITILQKYVVEKGKRAFKYLGIEVL